jgi:hypothetical protein
MTQFEAIAGTPTLSFFSDIISLLPIGRAAVVQFVFYLILSFTNLEFLLKKAQETS